MVKLLLLGLALFLLIGWLARKQILKLPTWRIGSAVASVALFSVMLFFLLRNAWGPAVVFGVVGVWLAVAARMPRGGWGPGPKASPPAQAQGEMSLSQARAILGVSEGASKDEIKAAYARLIQRVHPDKGGAVGLAAQLNAARDRLLKG